MKGLLAEDSGQVFSKIKRQLFRRVRKQMAGRNFFVRYQLAGREIVLPLEHDLPILRKVYPQYSANVGRLCSYIRKKYPGLQMIDVGANVGDTVAIVREHCDCAILCIEGNEYYFGLLQENLRRGRYESVRAVRALVATYTGELKGNLVSSSGSAHFVEDDGASVQVSRLSDVLERFPEFRDPKFLKIDTDGFDCGILRSEVEWLALHRPAIFFEYDPFFFHQQPYDGTQIFKDLAKAGYRYGMLYDNFGDYLLSLDLQRDANQLEDLQTYYLGRLGHTYMDVLLLHQQDGDLSAEIRNQELRWSAQWRLMEKPGGH